jgi:hypothetical protein
VKKTPDDGQRNCPKLVEFYSKNKFEKLVHLVGFITLLLLLHMRPTTDRRSNPFQSSSTDVLRGSMPLSISSLQVLPVMLQD